MQIENIPVFLGFGSDTLPVGRATIDDDMDLVTITVTKSELVKAIAHRLVVGSFQAFYLDFDCRTTAEAKE